MIDLVCLSPIPGLAVKTYLDLGRYAKVLLVEVFWADIERRDLRKR